MKIIKKREEKSRLFNPFATREKTVASQFLFVEKKKKKKKNMPEKDTSIVRNISRIASYAEQ